jgi:hypothetical protein
MCAQTNSGVLCIRIQKVFICMACHVHAKSAIWVGIHNLSQGVPCLILAVIIPPQITHFEALSL